MADINTDFYPQADPSGFLGTAEKAMAIRNLGAQNALLGIDVQQNKQNLAQQQLGYISQNLGLLAQDPNLNADKALALGDRFVKEGVLSPQLWAVESANIQATGGDPAKLRPLLLNYSQRALDAQSQFNNTVGTGSTIDTGPSTVVGTYSPVNGFHPQGSVLHALNPGQASTPVTVTLPDGSTRTMTQAQFNQLTGTSTTGAPEAGNPLTGASGVAVPPTSPVSAADDSSGLPGIGAPSPQRQKMFEASTAQYQAAKANDANYTANLVPLQKSLELLPNTPLFGRGAELPTQLAQVFNTFGIPIGSDQSKNASELDKYLTQIARGSGAAANSDQQLVAAFSANPNMSTDKAAAQDVIKTMMALQRMQHAAVTLAQRRGMDNTPQNYSTFASQWGAQQDPRAYGVDLMTPAAKAALLKELNANPAEKAKFAASLRSAVSAGVLGGLPGAE